MYLVSIPRDTSVIIPAFPKTHFGGGSYKINAAFLFGSNNNGRVAGGFQLLAKTIKNTSGITFNAAAAMNFSGFEDIVTKLGGVNMYVDETTTSIHHGYLAARGPSAYAKPYNINPNTGVPVCSTLGSPSTAIRSNAPSPASPQSNTRKGCSTYRPTTRWTSCAAATDWSAPTTPANATSNSSSKP